MDDNTIRVSTGFWLGTPLCRPYSCIHCGEEVDNLTTHGLSCRCSEGRHHRHAEMNNIMKRALISPKLPFCLESSGLHRTDGKRPDGIMVKERKDLHLGFDLPGHLCPLLLSQCHQGGRGSSCAGRERKVTKYVNLTLEHLYSPITVETMGVLGPRTKALLRDLGQQVTQTTGEEAATTYLVQRLSVAVQHGNCALSVMGTRGQLDSGLFY